MRPVTPKRAAEMGAPAPSSGMMSGVGTAVFSGGGTTGEVERGVFVGGLGVAVGGTAVAVGGTGVSVGGWVGVDVIPAITAETGLIANRVDNSVKKPKINISF